MKPLKAAIPIAKWLLRLSAGVIVYDRFWRTVENVNVESVSFYIALGIILSTLLLLIGGLLKNNTTTIISGLFIFGISVALMLIGGFTVGKLLENFVLAAIGFYFVARGNWG